MRSQFANKKHFHRCRGILTFEWMLLFVLLTIGIIGGIAAMRDSISLKFISTSQALGALDTSYDVPAYESKNKNSENNINAPAQTHDHQEITLNSVQAGNKN